MVAVRATTDQIPALAEEIEYRRRDGRDIYDEWRNGVYWLVDVPPPEYGELLVDLAVLLHPLAESRGLHIASPVNIGIDRDDCRVPNMGVYRPNTPRTAPAFLETALLVVELLAPGERSGENLPFYRAWNVMECLEIDLERLTAELFANTTEEGWCPVTHSGVLPLVVTRPALTAEGGQLRLSDYDN
jgi:hypothetical protein